MKQQDIYDMIEKKVMEQLENGIIPWRRCYHVSGGDTCISHQTGNEYSWLNQMLLDLPGEYWTFENVQKEGLRIRKGAKSRKIVFWKVLTYADSKESDGGDGEELVRNIPFLKYYNVFHESDIEGLETKPKKDIGISEEEREERNRNSIEDADRIVNEYLHANKEITLHTVDGTPCFSPSMKTICMPEKCQFDSLADYYSTIFHEIIHSTRDAVGRIKDSGADGRAKEELVAEIGAAFLCGAAGIREEEVIKNNSAYCACWLKALKNNIKHLVWASSKAERAAKYVLGDKDDSEQVSNG
jgi:antirestriction protein ArdC